MDGSTSRTATTGIKATRAKASSEQLATQQIRCVRTSAGMSRVGQFVEVHDGAQQGPQEPGVVAIRHLSLTTLFWFRIAIDRSSAWRLPSMMSWVAAI